MAQSGAKLIEVGTTNRVSLEDYRQQITDPDKNVAAILRVHSSNFKIIGFTSEVSLEELVSLTTQEFRQLPITHYPLHILDDLGSGALIDTSQFGLSSEPMPQDSVKAGADVICFSGDKLLGGPQAGLIVGKRGAVARCRKHPLARAFRADKFTLAALGATLLHYARGEAHREVPVVRMLALRKEEIALRAERVLLAISQWLLANRLRAALVDGESTVGGGSLPGETLPTTLIALEGSDPEALLVKLRAVGVIARIKDNCVMLDMRTVLNDDELVDRLRLI